MIDTNQDLISVLQNIEQVINVPFLKNYEFWLGIANGLILIITLIFLVKYTIATQEMKEEMIKTRKDIFLPAVYIVSIKHTNRGEKFTVKVSNNGRGRAFYNRFQIEDENEKKVISGVGELGGQMIENSNDINNRHPIELFTVQNEKEFFHNKFIKLFFKDVFGRPFIVKGRIVFDSDKGLHCKESSEMEFTDAKKEKIKR